MDEPNARKALYGGGGVVDRPVVHHNDFERPPRRLA